MVRGRKEAHGGEGRTDGALGHDDARDLGSSRMGHVRQKAARALLVPYVRQTALNVP